MATAYGPWVVNNAYRAVIIVTVSAGASSNATLTVRGRLQSLYGKAVDCSSTWRFTWNGSAQSEETGDLTFDNGDTVTLNTYSVSIARETANKTIKCSVRVTSYAGTSTAEVPVTIPALQSYSVSYSANGGSGAPVSQTKWYGKSLTVSSTKPTRSGYKFVHWSYTYGGSPVTVAAGGTILASHNSDLLLTAVWEQVYQYPEITKMNIFRCDSNGNQLDEGTNAKLEVDWKVNHTSATPSSITIRYKEVDSSTWTTAYLRNISLSGMSGTAESLVYSASSGTALASFGSNKAYNVEVTFKDLYQSQNHTSRTSRTLSPAYFTLDLKPGDKTTGGIGIAHSADIAGVMRIGFDVQIDSYRTNSNSYERGNFSCVDNRLPASSSSTNLAESKWGNGLFFYGNGFNPNSGNPIYQSHGYVRGVNLSSGARGVQIEAQRYVNSTRTTNALNITVDSSGNGHATLGGTGIFMCHGSVGQTISVPANGVGSYEITFGHTYSSAPHVFPVLYSTTDTNVSAFGGLSVAIYSVSQTKATIKIYNNTSTARTPGLHWLAIGD